MGCSIHNLINQSIEQSYFSDILGSDVFFAAGDFLGSRDFDAIDACYAVQPIPLVGWRPQGRMIKAYYPSPKLTTENQIDEPKRSLKRRIGPNMQTKDHQGDPRIII